MARDNRIDSLKGFLIILVIMGHVITTLNNVNIVNHAVMGLIYVFHMPLFILISGYLTKSPEKQKASDLWRSILNIFVTLVVFQVLSGLMVLAVGGDVISSIKVFPFGILWYLLSLIFWRIMLYYTPKAILNRPILYLSIALIASLLCGLTHLGRFLSLQRTLNFYFFFLLGYYYRQGALSTQWWKNNMLHLATAVILLPIIFILFPRCGNIMNGADHYPVSGLPEKALILICSTAMSLLVFNIVRDFKWLRVIGKDSLFHYLYHIFIVSGLYLLSLKYQWPTTFPMILLHTAVTIAVLLLMSKVPLFRWLTHPTFKPKKVQKPTS